VAPPAAGTNVPFLFIYTRHVSTCGRRGRRPSLRASGVPAAQLRGILEGRRPRRPRVQISLYSPLEIATFIRELPTARRREYPSLNIAPPSTP
jgi:hypothetical protein